MGPCSGCEQQSDSRWFQDSGTNIIKQGEIVKGIACGSVAQWLECLHGKREILGLSPGRAICFFLACDIWCVRARAASSKMDCLVGSGMVGSVQIRG